MKDGPLNSPSNNVLRKLKKLGAMSSTKHPTASPEVAEGSPSVASAVVLPGVAASSVARSGFNFFANAAGPFRRSMVETQSTNENPTPLMTPGNYKNIIN